MDQGILAVGIPGRAEIKVDGQRVRVGLQPACGKPENLSLLCRSSSRSQADAINVFSVQLNIERSLRTLRHTSVFELQKERHRLTRLQEKIWRQSKVNVDRSRTLQLKPVRRGVGPDRSGLV